MKRIIFTLYALSFFAVSDIVAQHNADWPFYIAFEDAIGAKDTVWFVMDQNATNGADEFLNEVPVTLDENVFNVWTYVTDLENHYKVSARPLNGFPSVKWLYRRGNICQQLLLSHYGNMGLITV